MSVSMSKMSEVRSHSVEGVAAMPVVQVENVTKHYEEPGQPAAVALDGVGLKVEPGEGGEHDF